MTVDRKVLALARSDGSPPTGKSEGAETAMIPAPARSVLQLAEHRWNHDRLRRQLRDDVILTSPCLETFGRDDFERSSNAGQDLILPALRCVVPARNADCAVLRTQHFLDLRLEDRPELVAKRAELECHELALRANVQRLELRHEFELLLDLRPKYGLERSIQGLRNCAENAHALRVLRFALSERPALQVSLHPALVQVLLDEHEHLLRIDLDLHPVTLLSESTVTTLFYRIAQRNDMDAGKEIFAQRSTRTPMSENVVGG